MPSTPTTHVPFRRLAVATALVLGLLLVPAVAWASSSPSPSPTASPTAEPTPTPTPTPTTTPSPGQSITLSASSAAVMYGQTIKVTGAVLPASAGQEVVVALGGVRLDSAFTDASGAFSLTVTPRKSGELVAKLADGTRSQPVRVVVKPKVSVSWATPIPFAAVSLVIKVVPAEYSGTVTAVVTHRGAAVGTFKAATHNGRAVLQLPLRGVGAFPVELSLPSADGLGARIARTTVQVSDAKLSTGSSGPRVKAMLTQLSRLKFRVPYIGTSFNSEVADAVVAFQKAYGLTRDYVFGPQAWRKLETAQVIRPRHADAGTHLEVDKGRQIAMVVKDGAVYGIIAVSTGATGNTPECTFHIFVKSLYAPSNFGGQLFRSMGFYADFAMHGYAPVPPYPASHGCVREPMWVAQWMYDQSWVGETIYLYH
jgi:peptidoglycan hydrolase-like protein with peptidoglycan-binding domain